MWDGERRCIGSCTIFRSNGRRAKLENDEMRYRVIIEQDETGIFVAECPSLPGCISQGGTRDEALRNIKVAMQGYIESLEEHGEPIPPSISEETVEVSL